MRHEALLEIRLCSPEEARIFDLSLQPDNTPLPPGLAIEVVRQAEKITYEVACSDRPLETLLSTLDDILRALIQVERVACGKG
jgi:hypothetical protein